MSNHSISLPFFQKREGKKNVLLSFLKFIHEITPACIKARLGLFLAYEWEKRVDEHQFLAFLKSICNLLLVYLPPFYALRLFQRICSDEPLYPIEYEIVLTTTRVIFTRSKRTLQHICLKIWQRSDDEVCNNKLLVRNEVYLLEGLAFNRKFAPNVYLGIAPVALSKDTKRIRRGRLIENPKKNDLEPKVEYALVMRCLDEQWRLDKRLRHNWLILEFLAKQVALMHSQLENALPNYGTAACILAKLNLNRDLFLEALNRLFQDQSNVTRYEWISECIAQAGEAYTELFRYRQQSGYIKQCHGDLKATNLWLRPAKTFFWGLKKFPQQLLALDCIDFNPEFCHIDTLSDVAMLAIDIEMHTQNWDTEKDLKLGQVIANYFLDCYLLERKESNEHVWPLLRYYMTEKAMVCAYVSILYDNQPELGEKYLEIAYMHAKQIESPISFLPIEPPVQFKSF